MRPVTTTCCKAADSENPMPTRRQLHICKVVEKEPDFDIAWDLLSLYYREGSTFPPFMIDCLVGQENLDLNLGT